MSLERSPDLEKIILDRIREVGGITFAEFMALCLYHPQYGYYMGPRQRIGKGGDFFTSSSVHPIFGRLVQRQLRQMWQMMGKGPFTIAEQGAGEGHLALDILAAAAEESPEFYRHLDYRLVEISPDHRRRQEELLAGHRARVDWCGLGDLAAFEGCFLSNELVDAFPVHLVEQRGGALQEVHVVERDGAFGEELRPPSTPALAAHLRSLGVELAEGNRAEINLVAGRWLDRVAGLLGRGFVLTIDYGYPAADLFAPFRREGTLMCYFHHTTGTDPYIRAGCQDITAHVDFTSLQRAGEARGLSMLWFGAQYRFLLALGFVEALIEAEGREPDEARARALRLTLKNLIVPEEGMGETFKVLVQEKGIGRAELLCSRPVRNILPPGAMG